MQNVTAGHPETWVFDVLESKWSVCVVPPSSSITTKKVSSKYLLFNSFCSVDLHAKIVKFRIAITSIWRPLAEITVFHV